MTALALQMSLILVVGFRVVCRCTISCAQADSEAHILGITMTVRVDKPGKKEEEEAEEHEGAVLEAVVEEEEHSEGHSIKVERRKGKIGRAHV